ncbi:hypothetical protein SAURM35S_01278 [Streptomyces aurantiogriseus]
MLRALGEQPLAQQAQPPVADPLQTEVALDDGLSDRARLGVRDRVPAQRGLGDDHPQRPPVVLRAYGGPVQDGLRRGVAQRAGPAGGRRDREGPGDGDAEVDQDQALGGVTVVAEHQVGRFHVTVHDLRRVQRGQRPVQPRHRRPDAVGRHPATVLAAQIGGEVAAAVRGQQVVRRPVGRALLQHVRQPGVQVGPQQRGHSGVGDGGGVEPLQDPYGPVRGQAVLDPEHGRAQLGGVPRLRPAVLGPLAVPGQRLQQLEPVGERGRQPVRVGARVGSEGAAGRRIGVDEGRCGEAVVRIRGLESVRVGAAGRIDGKSHGIHLGVKRTRWPVSGREVKTAWRDVRLIRRERAGNSTARRKAPREGGPGEGASRAGRIAAPSRRTPENAEFRTLSWSVGPIRSVLPEEPGALPEEPAAAPPTRLS